MSGDVFGNGMLLSRHIELVAAFDHRHVFLDPDPDPEVASRNASGCSSAIAPRGPTTTPALISEGGGVHERDAKSIAITPQVAEALGIDSESCLRRS